MRKIITRPISLLLMIFASVFLLFDLYGLVQVWRLRPEVTTSLLTGLDTIDSTLKTTSAGLVTLDSALDNAKNMVNTLDNTTQALAGTLRDTRLMVAPITTLFSLDLPNTISSTQTSLASAQSSALLIDNIMTALTNIPLLSLGQYKPSIPLNVALGEVSSSLDNLSPSFSTIERSLKKTDLDLISLQVEITVIGDDIAQFKQNLVDAQEIVTQYQLLVESFQKQSETAHKVIPGWVNIATWVVTMILIWLGVTQVSVFLQGWEGVG